MKFINLMILTGGDFQAGFDTDAAKSLVSTYLDPLMTFALWCIPTIAMLACAKETIVWLGQEKDERERDSLFKTYKKIIGFAIVGCIIPAIFKIFGFGG